MAVKLCMDVHVPAPITDQLRRRGVDVVTAQDDDATEVLDADLLERMRGMGRVIFTQDIRFYAMAEEWQRIGRQFSGLIFGHQLGGTIGQFVQDLELIAIASNMPEWENVVDRIPFKTTGKP